MMTLAAGYDFFEKPSKKGFESPQDLSFQVKIRLKFTPFWPLFDALGCLLPKTKIALPVIQKGDFGVIENFLVVPVGHDPTTP